MGKQINNCNNIGDNMINAKLKTEISKISSLATLNELSAYIGSCKTALGKSTISAGDKVYVVQKTKKTLGTCIEVIIGLSPLSFVTRISILHPIGKNSLLG